MTDQFPSVEIDMDEQQQFNCIKSYVLRHFNQPSIQVFNELSSRLTSFEQLYAATGQAVLNQAINELIELDMQTQQLELPLQEKLTNEIE